MLRRLLIPRLVVLVGLTAGQLGIIRPCSAAAPEAQTAAASIAASAEEQRLAQSVQPFVDRGELAGAVMLVANKDEVLARAAVGWANIGDQKPMSPDNVFWIASQTKPVTGVAVMMLVDEGKVSLDDPVENFLPEFRDQMVIAGRSDTEIVLKKRTRSITVRNLLAHTSGMPFKSALEEPTLDLFPLAARVRSYAMTPLDADPNTKYQYSNAGINTAARIVEVVSGRSFEQFLDERLFLPLGMTNTTFWPDTVAAERVATAYQVGANNTLEATTIGQLKYPLTDKVERAAMPAGGLFSTADDLAIFYRMLLAGGEYGGKRYLSGAAVQALTQRQTPLELPNSYGLGFVVGDDFFGHGGAYSTNSIAETRNGLILIWLVQHANFPGDGAKAREAFEHAARAEFGPRK